jgi:hypothetical protein
MFIDVNMLKRIVQGFVNHEELIYSYFIELLGFNWSYIKNPQQDKDHVYKIQQQKGVNTSGGVLGWN